MKKSIFLSLLFCANLNFGSGSVREEFNANGIPFNRNVSESERQALNSNSQQSKFDRFLTIIKNNHGFKGKRS